MTDRSYEDALSAAAAVTVRNQGTVVLRNVQRMSPAARQEVLLFSPSRIVVVGGSLEFAAGMTVAQ